MSPGESAPNAPSAAPEGGSVDDELSWSVVLAYGGGNFAAAILPSVLVAWILYFYSPPEGKGVVLLSPAVVGAARFVERILGFVIEPVVGYLSDKTNSRFGRRLPWIGIGAPFLCMSFAAIWFPPSGRPVDDWVVILFFVCNLTIFWTAFTAVVAPYLALLPELSTTHSGRIRLSVWMAVYEVVGNVFGSLGAGYLAGLGAVAFAGIAFANGYELLGCVVGGVALLVWGLLLVFVREPPRTEAHAVRFSLVQAAMESLRNPQFLPYAFALGGYKMASTCAVVAVPFVATELMGLAEAEAGAMLAIIILVALLAFPIVQRLANKHGKPKVFRWGGVGLIAVLPLIGTIGMFPGLDPRIQGAVIFALAGFPVATLFVLPRPLLADVIDLDEVRTGFRREAMYNGMVGVIEKAGDALAVGAIGVILDQLGRSAAQPLGLRVVGIAAAVGAGFGLFMFRKYEGDA